MLPGENSEQRERRPSINADDPEVAASNDPKSRAAKERNFAMVLWSASWLDTLPQAILIGLLAGEGRLHLSFVLAAFLANFPQALASASLLMEFKASPMKVGNWVIHFSAYGCVLQIHSYAAHGDAGAAGVVFDLAHLVSGGVSSRMGDAGRGPGWRRWRHQADDREHCLRVDWRGYDRLHIGDYAAGTHTHTHSLTHLGLTATYRSRLTAQPRCVARLNLRLHSSALDATRPCQDCCVRLALWQH